MKEKITGIIVFALILLVAAGIHFSRHSRPKVLLKGYVGGEKIGFLENEQVRSLLLRRYGIELDYYKAGSIEMVSEAPAADVDFLWPSSPVALEIFKMRFAQHLEKSEQVFNSPIVLYSWKLVAQALEGREIVSRMTNGYYTVDLPHLVELICKKTSWADVGLQVLYGNVAVITTDPTKSNSGNMFSGLLANMLNNGQVVDDAVLTNVLTSVIDIYARLGYLEHSSGDLFEQYLRTGVGAKPLIAGYENQIVEFSLAHRELWPAIKDDLCILYPIPTVWSAHPVMALKPRAKILIKALMDEDIQRIAWEQHGFRTGLIGVDNDPKVLNIAGIPDKIHKVIPMPAPGIMDRIIKAIAASR